MSQPGLAMCNSGRPIRFSLLASIILTVAPCAGADNGPVIATIVNAAGDAQIAAASPGSLISIYGTGLSEQVALGQPGADGRLPSILAGTDILIGDSLAALLYVSPTQINAQVPYEVRPGARLLTLHTAGGQNVFRTLNVQAASPGLFSGAVVRASDYSPVTKASAVREGDAIVIYCTGLGDVTPAVASGQTAPATPLSYTSVTPQVNIAGAMARVLYAVVSPTFIGLYQIGAVIPPGTQPGTALLNVTAAGVSSNTLPLYIGGSAPPPRFPGTIAGQIWQSTAVAVADLNRDGRQDIVAGNHPAASAQLTVFLGSDTTLYEPGVGTPLGFSNRNDVGALLAADFNSDGNAEIAAAENVNGEVILFAGEASGALNELGRNSFGGPASAVAVGDVNGDGAPDLIALGGGSISVLLNDGHGAFQPVRKTPLAVNPGVMSTADFDGDGKTDVLVYAYGLALFRSDGTGGFKPGPVTQSKVSLLKSVFAADVNRDGIADVVTVGGYGPYYVSVFLGDGRGGFRETDYQVPSLIGSSALIADVNGDSIPDVLIAAPTNSVVYLFTGGSDGGLDPPLAIQTSGSKILAVTDATGDGVSDLLMEGGSHIIVYRGMGAGFHADVATETGFPGTAPLRAAFDFDRDGLPDLIVGREDMSGSMQGLEIWRNTGRGDFVLVKTMRARDTADSAAAGDLNGDGIADLVIGTHYPAWISVFLGKPGGDFSPETVDQRYYSSLSLPKSIVLCDWDGDGRLDALVDVGRPVLFRGRGDGALEQWRDLTDTTVSFLSVADFDRDGHPDLAGSFLGGVGVALNDGRGGLQATRFIVPLPTPVAFLGSGDFDGDGTPDLLHILPGSSGCEGRIYRGLGNGSFAGALTSRLDCWGEVVIADFNQDGRADVLLRDSPSSATLYLTNSEGSLSAVQHFMMPLRSSSPILARDVDGDGKTDLVYQTDSGTRTLLQR